MKITISPDSFKGSLSAKQAADIIAEAGYDVFGEIEIDQKPMADGGEGTVDALIFSTDGKRFHKEVKGPLGEQVEAYYGVHGSEQTAFVEVGNTAGLVQVPENKRNPFHTTSYGLGEIILEVVDQGYREIIIGLGGSATNDGGLGMLTALGAKFFDDSGVEVGVYGEDLLNVSQVDLSGLDERLFDIELKVASDVNNPLCGPNGASAVFGPQKGATVQQIKELDQAIGSYGSLVNEPIKDHPGAGAAGGLGFALLALGASLESGAELVGQTMGLEDTIKNSDFVVTGEGQSDHQTLYGKAPSYVAQLAKQYDKPVVLLSGAIDDPQLKLLDYFTSVFSIVNQPMTLQKAMNQVEQLLYNQSYQIFQFYKQVGESK
ncbi:glycerate kinase [Aquisalibacillus elongatus]|uniref:Glycerate kinase n=1 Tax=Aquisalibacillus elongatus TaxID=485577 RepID=A0A3N5B765_9BACI|nr:glycerate kinase [Aquisalibacillus elongatus]RPF53203.1 glycerate kinase [Aquisalibacillus elongatus]